MDMCYNLDEPLICHAMPVTKDNCLQGYFPQGDEVAPLLPHKTQGQMKVRFHPDCPLESMGLITDHE